MLRPQLPNGTRRADPPLLLPSFPVLPPAGVRCSMRPIHTICIEDRTKTIAISYAASYLSFSCSFPPSDARVGWNGALWNKVCRERNQRPGQRTRRLARCLPPSSKIIDHQSRTRPRGEQNVSEEQIRTEVSFDRCGGSLCQGELGGRA